MAPLANPKHEIMSQALASNGFNQTDAYLTVNGEVSRSSASVLASTTIRNHEEIITRAKELALEATETSPTALFTHLGHKLKAQKPFAVRGEVIWTDDHGAQIEAAKTLAKMLGVFSDGTFNDNRTMNLHYDGSLDTRIDKLAASIERIESTGQHDATEREAAIDDD